MGRSGGSSNIKVFFTRWGDGSIIHIGSGGRRSRLVLSVLEMLDWWERQHLIYEFGFGWVGVVAVVISKFSLRDGGMEELFISVVVEEGHV